MTTREAEEQGARFALYVIQESTPGYLPEEDEPTVVLGLSGAREEASRLLRERAEQAEAFLAESGDEGTFGAVLLGLAGEAEALPTEGGAFYFNTPEEGQIASLGRVLTVALVSEPDEAELLASCCWQGSPPDALLSAAEELGLDVEPERCDPHALLLRLRDGLCDGLGTIVSARPGVGYLPCSGCAACAQGEQEQAERLLAAEDLSALSPADALKASYLQARLLGESGEAVDGLSLLLDACARFLGEASS